MPAATLADGSPASPQSSSSNTAVSSLKMNDRGPFASEKPIRPALDNSLQTCAGMREQRGAGDRTLNACITASHRGERFACQAWFQSYWRAADHLVCDGTR